MDVRRGLITFIVSKVNTKQGYISTYEGGPSSLITSICIMRVEGLRLLEMARSKNKGLVSVSPYLSVCVSAL